MASAARRDEMIDSSRQIGVATTRGELGVAADVVLGERLLDQQQVEGVELARGAAASASV